MQVCWILSQGYFKCNIDGSLRGNSGSISIIFYIINHDGDLQYATFQQFRESTKTFVEALALK